MLFMLVSACASGAKPMPCASLSDCKRYEGKQIQLTGAYTVFATPDHETRQVYVRFADGSDGPFLGAWGHGDHLRPVDEIAKLAGKRVRVVGTFRARMPAAPNAHPDAASFDGPCLHPLALVELE